MELHRGGFAAPDLIADATRELLTRHALNRMKSLIGFEVEGRGGVARRDEPEHLPSGALVAGRDPEPPLKETMLPGIYLVRHGETDWSVSGQYTSHTDLPLTAHGEDLARELGRRLSAISFARVLSSPRQRARRTCELVLPGRPLEIEPDLADWNYGDFEGHHSAVAHEHCPAWNLFRDGCPHGEVPAQISARADRLIARLRTLDGNIALFSHGHFGRVLAARWIGLPVSDARHFLLNTASVSIFSLERDPARTPVIALWNASSKTVPL